MEIDVGSCKKNTIKLPCQHTALQISGDFDSGNLNAAAMDLSSQELQLGFAKDKPTKGSGKTWFYFYLKAEAEVPLLKVCLLKVNTLSVASKIFDLYRPVVRQQGGEWSRLESPVEFQSLPDGDINLKMTVSLKARVKLFIALTYPWSFEEHESHMEVIQNRMRGREDIYFNMETMVFSPEGRPVRLLALGAPDCLAHPPEKYQEHLFPLRDREQHFREIHKPLILVTSRVHPGEVGASHALNGMLEFLTSHDDTAAKLRAEFYFLIVPMLNPDGVFNGHNRMDTLGQNLNRFYHLPDLALQPSCYAVKALLQQSRRQLFAFFDLHGHANKKSCFLFGNSITNSRLQTESVLFAKHLSSICEHIEFKACNFSKKQMASRDKNEEMSKEGCARVVVHRWTNSPYCYTLETGLFKDVRTDEKGIQRFGDKFYDPTIYAEIGRKMLISFAAVVKKDKSLEEMRKFCADYVARLDKAKKEKPVPKSLKMLASETEAEGYAFASEKKESSESKGLSKKKQSGEALERLQRGKEITGILRKNKVVLLNRNEEDDDE